VFYIQFVLRHLEKQREVSGEAGADDSLREVLADDARLRIDTLKALLKDAESGDRRLVPLALSAQLMVAVSRRDDARQLVNEFADEQLPAAGSDSERAKLYLQLGNLCSSVGFYEDAERWYRRLMDIAPNSYVLVARALFQQEKVKEAVDMCLRAAPDRPSAEAATVLAQLLSAANVDAALDRRAAPLIDSALQSNPDNVALLMSVAVLHVTRNEYDEAIGLFQRVVDLEPNHDLALNNLATLLAERPTQIRAAQQYVERAIAVSGRSPGLMDTLGTILVRNDQHEQAVAALEEAVAGGASDPRYYFHLAVAYQRSGRKAEAREAFESSRKLGLESTILTSGDRELLASLQHDLLTSNYQQ
jgi:tetratricopeptide (TPR) repeat protein